MANLPDLSRWLDPKTFVKIHQWLKAIADNTTPPLQMQDGVAVSKGIVPGESYVHKFGYASDFDTSDGEVTIWDGAEDGTAWEQMTYQYSSTADIDSVSSSDAGDTTEVTVQGLDANYNLVTQTVTLNGQTTVTLDTPLFRCFRAYNSNSSVFAGRVFVFVAGATTGGVPDANTDIRAIIRPGAQQTLMSVYTVPAGKKALLHSVVATIAGASKTSNYIIRMYARESGGVFRLQNIGALSDAGTSALQLNYAVPLVVNEKTDIEFTAEMTAAGGVSGSVSGNFLLQLVPV